MADLPAPALTVDKCGFVTDTGGGLKRCNVPAVHVGITLQGMSVALCRTHAAHVAACRECGRALARVAGL